MSIVKSILVVGIALYVLMALVVYFFQERFIFLGQPIPQDHVYHFPVPFEERDYNTPGGGKINALYFHTEDPRGVIFYHHGNGGELPRWGEISYFFLEQGYDVLLYDYRGYGKSTGRRTEKHMLGDAQALYEKLLEQWPEEKIIVYGRSLGSGPASYVAGRNQPALLIMETPFFSLKEMADHYFPILPAGRLVRFRFPNATHLANASTNVHIFHGTEDRVVPYASGLKLYESLPPERTFLYTIPGGNHHNLSEYTAFRSGITRLLR